MQPRISISRTVAITCPIDAVFAFLCRVESLPAWDRAVVRARRRSDGTVGIGMVFEQAIARDGTAALAESMVIAYEPPHQLGWLCELEGERETTRITLESVDGSTVVRIRRQVASWDRDAEAELSRLDASLRALCRLLVADHSGPEGAGGQTGIQPRGEEER